MSWTVVRMYILVLSKPIGVNGRTNSFLESIRFFIYHCYVAGDNSWSSPQIK